MKKFLENLALTADIKLRQGLNYIKNIKNSCVKVVVASLLYK